MSEEDALNVAGPSAPRLAPASVSDTSSIAHPAAEADSAPSGMSKSAMKKAAKRAKFEALKPARRAAERARKKETAAHLKEGYAAGTLSETEKQAYEDKLGRHRAKIAAGRREKHREEGDFWKGGVVIDLGFDELMTDQEISSMASQVGYVYSTNRVAEKPFASLIFSSFSETKSPRLWEHMKKANYERWPRCIWRGGDVDQLGLSNTSDASEADGGEEGTNVGDGEAANITLPAEDAGGNVLRGKQLVYLSADSPDEMKELSEHEVYIIGGLVDRNRHKLLCQQKAERLGIRTARLPIGTYLANMPTRKVLTVNQVFQILTEFIARDSWAEAFEAVIPQRKYESLGRKGKRKLKRNGDVSSTLGKEDERDRDGEKSGVNEEEEETEEVDEAGDDDLAVAGGATLANRDEDPGPTL